MESSFNLLSFRHYINNTWHRIKIFFEVSELVVADISLTIEMTQS